MSPAMVPRRRRRALSLFFTASFEAVSLCPDSPGRRRVPGALTPGTDPRPRPRPQPPLPPRTRSIALRQPRRRRRHLAAASPKRPGKRLREPRARGGAGPARGGAARGGAAPAPEVCCPASLQGLGTGYYLSLTLSSFNSQPQNLLGFRPPSSGSSVLH